LAWHAVAGCDLTALRLIMNGGEHVNGRVCAAFEERFARIGLRRHSIQPSYGLAENASAVTLRPPGTPVPLRSFSRDGFALVPRPDAPSADVVELVGHGFPIAGTEIRIGRDGDASGPAEIHVRGASTAHTDGGWLATGDIGVVADGELYIVGRSKEIIKHGGRAFALSDIEHSLALLAPEHVGAVAVVASEIGEEREETLTILVEDPRDTDRQAFADRVRLTLLREFGLVAEDVVFVRRGRIPRTSSGKLRRSALRGVLDAHRAANADLPLEAPD
jgi:acyl-CoA synthetase (AMP-forming)/AMP-acid ligase II